MVRFGEQRTGVRRLLAAGLSVAVMLSSASKADVAAAELPRDPETLVQSLRKAIASRDFDTIKGIVNWEHVGKIKRRIVRFQILRGLGRPIRSISFERFPENGLAGVEATGKLVANMPVTNQIRVIYDEEPVSGSTAPPTSVFLVGKRDDVYQIALVVRKPGWDDD
jgi:hypothetical protein